MVLGTRENVSGHEEKLLKLLGPVGEVAAKAKKKRDSRYALTASRLCEIAGLETTSFSDAVKARLSDTVSSVCRAGSRFTRGCICVQFQEDGDQVIRTCGCSDKGKGYYECPNYFGVAGYGCGCGDADNGLPASATVAGG